MSTAVAQPAKPTKPAPADDSGISDDVMSGVMGRLGLAADLQAAFIPKPAPTEPPKGGTPNTEGATAEETETARIDQLAAEQGITTEEVIANEAEAETERLQKLADESGKTVEEIQAEEAESERLEALSAETGKTVDEIKAEEAAAGQGEAATAELTETKAKLEETTTRLAEVETELKTRGTKPIEIAATQLHPVLHADSESDIAKIDAQFGAFEKWALANWDGTQAVEGKDGQPGTPAYTAEQVRARYSDIKEQRAQLIPLARKSLATRRNYETEAKTAYPELFDAKKPEAQMLKQVLAQAPGLKVIFPNIHMIFGDAIRGEKIRQAEAAKKGKAAAPVRVAPKIAVRPAPGAGSPIGGAKPKPAKGAAGVSGVDIGAFVSGGSTRDSLVATLMKANL